MTKKTSTLEKKTFIGLVIRKFSEMGTFESSIKKIENKKFDLDLEYKTAQRYARNCLFSKTEDKEQFYRELNALMKQHAGASTDSITVEEAEAPVTVPASETPVTPVNDTKPVSAFWATPEAQPYLGLASWLVAIDRGTINRTIKEAKEFISTIDGYTDKLQALVVTQSKEQLRTLLRQVKECEAVLDRSEIENIWLEVSTETGNELIVKPYSRENGGETTQLVPITGTGL